MMSVTVTVDTDNGDCLTWPATFVDEHSIGWADNPLYFASTLDQALDQARKVLGSKIRNLYGDIREESPCN